MVVFKSRVIVKGENLEEIVQKYGDLELYSQEAVDCEADYDGIEEAYILNDSGYIDYNCEVTSEFF